MYILHFLLATQSLDIPSVGSGVLSSRLEIVTVGSHVALTKQRVSSDRGVGQ